MPSQYSLEEDRIPEGAWLSVEQERLRLDNKAAELRAQLKRVRGRRRLLPLLLIGVLAIVMVVGTATGLGSPSSLDAASVSKWILDINRSPLLATTLGAAIIGTIGLMISWTLAENSIVAEIELIESRKLISEKFTGPIGSAGAEDKHHAPESYFDSLVEINVVNLAEYYSLVKVHTNNSFRASLWAGGIGFVLILIGVIAAFGGAAAAAPARLAATSGVLVEFISGIFFYLYNRTVRQLKEYHDSLLSVQNILLSFKLIDDTEDMDARKEMTAKMCESLLIPVSMRSSMGAQRSRERTPRLSRKKAPQI